MIDLVAGTRPELIKIAPIAKRMSRSKYRIIFTGQHYDYNMSLQFMEELDIRADVSEELTETDSVGQMAEMMRFLAQNFASQKTDYSVVVGDTNSAFVGALSALKAGVKPVHVESGLRSNDWRMAEEHNRIMCDHISEILCAPTEENKKTLLGEKVHGKIFVTGNTVIDAVEQNVPKALLKFKMDVPDEFVLLTLHRAENVDDKELLSSIVNAVMKIKEKVVFPVHPRTLKRLKEFNLYGMLEKSRQVKMIEPVGYFDFLALLKKCSLVVTDSGGVQEECTAPSISKYVIVLRKSTERTESVKLGYSFLPKYLTTESIACEIKDKLEKGRPKIRTSPYGSGKAGDMIAKLLDGQ